MRKPNFFILGAPKCGTTSMSAWLAKHPNIYMSPLKEPYFFSPEIRNQFVNTWETYQRLFDGVLEKHVAVGEASTTYLFSTVAVPSIEANLPNSRYIVMIRNPVNMAHSLHQQQILSHNENVTDFRRAWNLSEARRAGREVPPKCKLPILLDYQSFCRLGEQLERLYTQVTADRVLVIVLGDVRENPRSAYLKVLEFLGVSDDGRSKFPVYNPAREWRSRWARSIIRGIERAVGYAKYSRNILPTRSLGIVRLMQLAAKRNRSRAPMPLDLTMEIASFFEDDISKLESLLEKDFSAWRNPSGR